eukprot:scaffold3567_cov26-Tisochrysis_lutea.AAC.3
MTCTPRYRGVEASRATALHLHVIARPLELDKIRYSASRSFFERHSAVSAASRASFSRASCQAASSWSLIPAEYTRKLKYCSGGSVAPDGHAVRSSRHAAAPVQSMAMHASGAKAAASLAAATQPRPNVPTAAARSSRRHVSPDPSSIRQTPRRPSASRPTSSSLIGWSADSSPTTLAGPQHSTRSVAPCESSALASERARIPLPEKGEKVNS